jgi:hypothetical protein
VRAEVGSGALVYASTMLWLSCLKNPKSIEPIVKFVSYLDQEYSLRTVNVSDDTLKVSVLRGIDGFLMFAFNYTAEYVAADVKMQVEQNGEYRVTELYTGNSATHTVENGTLAVNLGVTTQNVSIYHAEHIGNDGETRDAK